MIYSLIEGRKEENNYRSKTNNDIHAILLIFTILSYKEIKILNELYFDV